MIKVIVLRGGIGNQMFCYAFYLLLKNKFPFSFVEIDIYPNINDHNGFELSNIFKRIKIKKWHYYRRLFKIHSVFFTRIFFHNFYEKESCVYQKNLRSYYPYLVYNGFWQTEKYFKEFEKQIRELFSFDTNHLNVKSKSILNRIKSENSVSIHIRRKDYVNHSEQYGAICTSKYYTDAIDYLQKKNPNLSFFIFSDDSNWVKKNLNISSSFYVDWNMGLDSWQDMCLMSMCKYNIIANSTFSWWGAWLNSYKSKIVIAPKKWMNNKRCEDIIPENWIRI